MQSFHQLHMHECYISCQLCKNTDNFKSSCTEFIYITFFKHMPNVELLNVITGAVCGTDTSCPTTKHPIPFHHRWSPIYLYGYFFYVWWL